MKPPKGWKSVTLGGVADVISGYAFSSRDFQPSGVTVIKISNIRIGDVDLSEAQCVDPRFLSLDRKYHVTGGDILVSLTGSHMTQPNSVVGRVAWFRNSKHPCLLNQRAGKVIVRDSNICDPRFLFYMLREPNRMREIATMAHGAASQANVSPKQIESLRFSAPPIQAQRRIAHVLSAYDDLIQNNTHRIQILEDMAQRIYREWFVNFRFPGHKKVRMVRSELGLIPEFWQLDTLSNLCSAISSGGTPSRYRPELWEPPTVDWFKTKELRDGFLFGSEEKISKNGYGESSAKLFPAGTVVMAIYAAPTVGRLGILTKEATFNQAACGLIANSKTICTSFLYHLLLEMRPYFNRIAQGAAQQNISVEKVRDAVCVVPPWSYIEHFDRLVGQAMELVRNLSKTSVVLRQTRDLLLPKLVSGEITVDAAEREAAAQGA